jgi:hypothetical protein
MANSANNYKKSGMSKAAYVKKYGTTSGTYSATHGGKKKASSSSSGKSYDDIIKSILKSTPAQQKVLPDFETTYSPELMAEDYAQSEALYKPYFEQQIANELEDLNAWSESESTNYDRNLRRARFSLAAQGGAIGSERTTAEGEITTDHEKSVADTVRGTERQVGTAKVTGAGFQSGGQNQEGELVGKMTAAIQEGQLWYKNQRAQRYYGNANTYYTQPSTQSLYGTNM